jgi:hypothetical protein
MIMKSEQKSEDYREKAVLAARLAETCGLPQVREKHELAAGAWLALARMEDERSAVSHKLMAAAPVKPASPPRRHRARPVDASADIRLIGAPRAPSGKETDHGQGPEAIQARAAQTQAGDI